MTELLVAAAECQDQPWALAVIVVASLGLLAFVAWCVTR